MPHRKRCTKAVLRYRNAALAATCVLLTSSSLPVQSNTLATQKKNIVASVEQIPDVAPQLSNVITNKTTRLGANESLDALLIRQGVNIEQRGAAINALADFIDIKKLRAGDDIEIFMQNRDGNEAKLAAIHIHATKVPDLTIVANEHGEFLRLTEFASAWSTRVLTRTGTITHNFESDLVYAGVPSTVAKDTVVAFAYDSSLPKKFAKGTRFNIVYEGATTGNPEADANMLRYAEISICGRQHRVYRYQMPDGKISYVDEDGQGVVPLHLGMPITRTARMTSGFGWREHPVLMVRKFHNGVDWAAPKGTPVYASEGGTVDEIAWRGNYGRYIRVSHSSRVATTYAHLAKFANGLHNGSFVRKGQIIGYVGASGLATGNHLYYEVLVDNRHVDPLSPNLTMTINLDGKALKKLQKFAAQSADLSTAAIQTR